MSIPYMPLYVSDFDADTSHLSLEEDGAYNRLLRLCWRTPGCSIPDDDEWIKRRMRVSESEWLRVVKPVLEEFFKRDKARLFSVRQQREHERINDTHKKRREAGRKGGRPAKPRKTKQTVERQAEANGKQNESNQNHNQNHNQIGITNVILRALTDAGVSEEVATAFAEHRKAIRAKLTERSAKMIANKIREHPNADAVLCESIANGWRGVFPESVKQQRSQSSGSETAKRAAAKWRASRGVDSGPGEGSVVPLLHAGDRRRD